MTLRILSWQKILLSIIFSNFLLGDADTTDIDLDALWESTVWEEIDEIIDMKSQATDELKRDDRGLPIFDFSRRMNDHLTKDDCPNPTCDVYECQPYFWVPERKLCIYCGHRG